MIFPPYARDTSMPWEGPSGARDYFKIFKIMYCLFKYNIASCLCEIISIRRKTETQT
jgi:hypothetical protein